MISNFRRGAANRLHALELCDLSLDPPARYLRYALPPRLGKPLQLGFQFIRYPEIELPPVLLGFHVDCMALLVYIGIAYT